MFIGHEPCPNCRKRNQDRSGNNLGVWDDHKFCFACRYYEDSHDDLARVKNKFRENNKNKYDNLGVPPDCSVDLRKDALAWLKKYGLTNEEIDKNHALWSEYRQYLVFPIQNEEHNTVMWIGRYFGDDPKHPKYDIKGYKEDVFHILGEKSNTLVVVEDLISAIKVSRQYQVMPVFGASLSMKQMTTLVKDFGIKRLVIWLDPNKTQEALQFSKRAELFFEKSTVISSEVDPKDHSDLEIKMYVDRSLA